MLSTRLEDIPTAAESTMLTEKTLPLSIAARILKKSTIEGVRRSRSYPHQGWKIFYRWAFFQPTELLTLKTEREVILLGRLLEQQSVEHKTLSSAMAWGQIQQSLTEDEILTSNKIQINLPKSTNMKTTTVLTTWPWPAKKNPTGCSWTRTNKPM